MISETVRRGRQTVNAEKWANPRPTRERLSVPEMRARHDSQHRLTETTIKQVEQHCIRARSQSQ